ncbi:ROK family protein [Arthrobacter sp. SD76]|uniref:ROK family protein n=1 Tax=Arthrobacter sp. SD76 TaxID=3415007 RepID=UPI003C7133B1
MLGGLRLRYSASVKRSKGTPGATQEAGQLLRLSRAGDGTLTGQHIAVAASQGDPLARELFEALGDWIGRGLASLAAIIDPAVIVVGGGVAESEDFLLPAVRSAFQSRLPGRHDRPEARVIAASLGNDAGLVGVASLAATKTA